MATKKKSKYVNLRLTRSEARRLRDVLEVINIDTNGEAMGGREEIATIAEGNRPYYTSIDWVVFDKLHSMRGL